MAERKGGTTSIVVVTVSRTVDAAFCPPGAGGTRILQAPPSFVSLEMSLCVYVSLGVSLFLLSCLSGGISSLAAIIAPHSLVPSLQPLEIVRKQ